jgi:membrane-bound serine protease (ClpP class)
MMMQKFSFIAFLLAVLTIFSRLEAGSDQEKLPIDQKLAESIPYHEQGNNLIGYLTLGRDRPIDQSCYLQVKFALEEYRKQGVIFVMLHLDTPGGEVFPATKIAELLQEMDARYHIPVVAVIHNWALSAGAMLAYSCRFIGVHEGALMGAAEPVIAGGGKMETAPEKMISALRAEFASLAKFWGRNPLIAEAMVDKDLILVKRQGQIVRLQNEQEIRTGKHPDQIITKQGKLLTLDAEQLMQLGIADFVVPSVSTREVTQSEHKRGEWPALQTQLGNYPFFAQIPNAMIIAYSNWKVSFFALLMHPMVSSLLMIGLIVGIYLEMSSPGLGFPALLSLVCLGLILLSNFAAETIHWLEGLFVVLGIGLLLAEIFILPGFGIVGGIGLLLIIAGLLGMLLPNFQTTYFSWNWQEWNLPAMEFADQLIYHLAALVLAFLMIIVLARFVSPRLLKRSRIVLEEVHHQQETGLKILPAVGTEGEAFTSLRPGGKVLIQNHLYNALTEGDFIEQGHKVIVSKIQGNAMIVAKKEG